MRSFVEYLSYFIFSKPKLLLLPIDLQESFMKFLLTQSCKVADAVVKELLVGIIKYVRTQDEPNLVRLIRDLSRKAKAGIILQFVSL